VIIERASVRSRTASQGYTGRTEEEIRVDPETAEGERRRRRVGRHDPAVVARTRRDVTTARPGRPSAAKCLSVSAKEDPAMNTRRRPASILSALRRGPREPAAAQLAAARLGAAAIGAAAVGAVAVGALAIGRLAIGRAVVRRLKIEELEVNRLHVHELVVDQQATTPQPETTPSKTET
jgi:hypothetical protein